MGGGAGGGSGEWHRGSMVGPTSQWSDLGWQKVISWWRVTGWYRVIGWYRLVESNRLVE